MAEQTLFLTDPKKKKALLITILVSGFTTMLNTSTINIALPSFMSIFHTDIRTVQWLVVGYMLTLGMVMPLVGYFGDRYSYRRVYLAGLVAMGICALGCALADNIYVLIGLRLVKGAAAGFITPCTMTLLYKYIPKKEQASYLGLSVMAGSLGPAIGPTIAGFLLSVFNWHSLFLVNIPLIVVAFYLGHHSIPAEAPNKTGKLDLVGIVMVAIGSALILVGFTKVEDWGWGSLYFLSSIFVGVMMVVSFIGMEYRSSKPLLNFKVFKYQPFALTVFLTCTMNITFSITPLLMAVYLQTVQGHTPLEAGVILLLPAMFMVTGNYLSRFLVEWLANKWIIMLGLTIAALGNFQMSCVGIDTGVVAIILFMSLRYFGIGLINMPLTDYGMSIIPVALSGHASSMLSWCRQMSSVMWLNVLTTMLSLRISWHYLAGGQTGVVEEASLPYKLAQVQAVNDVFLCLTVILLLSVLICVKIKSQKPCRGCETDIE